MQLAYVFGHEFGLCDWPMCLSMDLAYVISLCIWPM